MTDDLSTAATGAVRWSDRESPRRLLVAGLILCLAAAAVYGTLRLTFGERPANVHVRWSATIDTETRTQLERVHHLTQAEFREGTTWAYSLDDVSAGNIRALIEDPRVEDTDQIHRTAFRPWRTAVRGPYITQWPNWIGTAMEILSGACLALGLLALGLTAVARAVAPRPVERPVAMLGYPLAHPVAASRWAAVRVWRWIGARIPPASAEGVAAFRILFGLSCLVFFVTHAVSTEWLALAGPPSSLQRVALWAFESFPAAVNWIRPWIVVWCMLFVAGAMARTSFVMLTAGALAWALIYTTRVGGHSVAVLPVAMLCLTWSRWGDAWSVDAWWKGRQHPERAKAAAGPGARRVYGYTTWVPGLVLGTSFAAAALAKIRESGFAWITNGTVKYHFLSDSGQAPVDWGLRLAHYDQIAVLLSFGAVATEALVIVGVCSTRYRYRLAAGMGALALLAGFWLFQGLFWSAWHILLLSFLPWHRVAGDNADPADSQTTVVGAGFSRPLQIAQVAIVALLMSQQVVVSAFRLEVDPLMSTYDMYSTSYGSPAEYERKAGLAYWMIGAFADGTTTACEVARETADDIRAGRSDDPPTARAIRSCFGSDRSLRTITIEGRRRLIDWTNWRFKDEVRVSIAGPIAVHP